MRTPAFFLLFSGLALAQLETPRVGCFLESGRVLEVIGVPRSFFLAHADSCVLPENRWHIVHEEDGQWLVRVDPVSGAIESRSRLGAGVFAVWLDGEVVNLDALHLPAPATRTAVLSPRWMLIVLDTGFRLILNRKGEWFSLPGREP
jgi:hypothetical protein